MIEDDDGVLFLSFFPFFFFLNFIIKRWKKSSRDKVTCFITRLIIATVESRMEASPILFFWNAVMRYIGC